MAEAQCVQRRHEATKLDSCSQSGRHIEVHGMWCVAASIGISIIASGRGAGEGGAGEGWGAEHNLRDDVPRILCGSAESCSGALAMSRMMHVTPGVTGRHWALTPGVTGRHWASTR